MPDIPEQEPVMDTGNPPQLQGELPMVRCFTCAMLSEVSFAANFMVRGIHVNITRPMSGTLRVPYCPKIRIAVEPACPRRCGCYKEVPPRGRQPYPTHGTQPH